MDRDEAMRLLEQARVAGGGLLGSDAARWTDWIEGQRDQLYAALMWFVEQNQGVEAVALVASISRYWLTRGSPREGGEWLDLALNASGAGRPSADRARALYGAGLLAFRQGDNERSRQLNTASLETARIAGDQATAVSALVGLARVALRDGDYVAVRARSEEGMAIARESGSRAAQAAPLHLLAAATRLEGDYTGARQLYHESIALNSELGNQRMIAMEQVNLGCVEVLAGDPLAAEPELRAGLRALRGGVDRDVIPVCLIGLASVAVSRASPARAARLLGAAEAEMERRGTAFDPDDQPVYDAAISRARAALDEASFATARAAGRALPLDAAANLALDETM